jgi:hypothetical protein
MTEREHDEDDEKRREHDGARQSINWIVSEIGSLSSQRNTIGQYIMNLTGGFMRTKVLAIQRAGRSKCHKAAINVNIIT